MKLDKQAMANEVDTEEREVRAKKKKEEDEEDQIHQIVWNSLLELRSDMQALNRAINFNEENPRKLAILINTRVRIQAQIFNCVALLKNPKLKLMTDSGRNRDLARLMQRALLDENPAVKKMIEEAKQKQTSSSDSSEKKKTDTDTPAGKAPS